MSSLSLCCVVDACELTLCSDVHVIHVIDMQGLGTPCKVLSPKAEGQKVYSSGNSMARANKITKCQTSASAFQGGLLGLVDVVSAFGRGRQGLADVAGF